MDDQQPWVSAHLFHYGDLDALVTAVVAPLVAELTGSGAIEGHFFLRYWEGGPHVRLRLRPANRDLAGPVRDLVRARATEYLASHSSTPRLAPESYRALAEKLGRAERRDEYETGLRPNDSVQFIAYRPEYAAYGDDACLAAVEQHFTESSTIALGLLRSGRSREQRAASALAALTTTVAVCAPELPEAAVRVRGARALVHPAGADERAYQQRCHALRRQVAQLWGYASQTGAADHGQLGHWVRSVRRLRDRLESLRAAGRCAPPDPGSPMAFLAAALPAGQHPVCLILLRCAHLLHNRLGLLAGDEARVAFLVARALSDLARPLSEVSPHGHS
jgi:hypothetical protein